MKNFPAYNLRSCRYL